MTTKDEIKCMSYVADAIAAIKAGRSIDNFIKVNMSHPDYDFYSGHVVFVKLTK